MCHTNTCCQDSYKRQITNTKKMMMIMLNDADDDNDNDMTTMTAIVAAMII
jgi:hypothetical protein